MLSIINYYNLSQNLENDHMQPIYLTLQVLNECVD